MMEQGVLTTLELSCNNEQLSHKHLSGKYTRGQDNRGDSIINTTVHKGQRIPKW